MLIFLEFPWHCRYRQHFRVIAATSSGPYGAQGAPYGIGRCKMQKRKLRQYGAASGIAGEAGTSG
jgi:hypothetical protein